MTENSENGKGCYCITCGKKFSRFGIARHRAMHRDRKEDCEITYSGGETWFYPYARNEAIKEINKSIREANEK